MRKPKCHEIQYIDFLIASPVAVSCCESSRSDPRCGLPAAHDSYNRLLHRLEPDPETLYQEVEPLIHKHLGLLVIDDSTLDKPYSEKIKPATHHWSGKHHAVVKGINLISRTDGDLMMPVDYRVYDMAGDHKTRNDHFQEMLDRAKQRGFTPEAVLFDSWYSSLENLKRVRDEFSRPILGRSGNGLMPRSHLCCRRVLPVRRPRTCTTSGRPWKDIANRVLGDMEMNGSALQIHRVHG